MPPNAHHGRGPAAGSTTALALARRLGDLEAPESEAGAVAGSTSLEEIELPPPPAAPPPPPSPPRPDRVRKPKRFYYCLPMLIRYRFPLLACFLLVFGALALGMLLVAARSDAAPGDLGGGLAVDDAPAAYDYDSAWAEGEEVDRDSDASDGAGSAGSGWTIDEAGEEELGDIVEAVVSEPPTGAPREGGEEEVGDPLVIEAAATPLPTDPPRLGAGDSSVDIMQAVMDPPSAAPGPRLTPFPTAAAAGETFPPTGDERTEPRWFKTSGARYAAFLADHEKTTSILGISGDYDPHTLAGTFCQVQGRALCGYDDYCPAGRGSVPYRGTGADRPKASAGEQWAPARQAGAWVQVGTMPMSEGGGADINYARCWTWDAWTNGGGGDVVAQWGEDHRWWILCCGDV